MSSQQSVYTAEVTYSIQSEHEHQTRTITRTLEARSPNSVKDYTVQQVPGDATIHRVGVWTGTKSDRPDAGHEHGLLTQSP